MIRVEAADGACLVINSGSYQSVHLREYAETTPGTKHHENQAEWVGVHSIGHELLWNEFNLYYVNVGKEV